MLGEYVGFLRFFAYCAMQARVVAFLVLAATITVSQARATENIDWSSVAEKIVGMEMRKAAVELLLLGVGSFERVAEPICGKDFIENSVADLRPPTNEGKPILLFRTKGAVLPNLTNMPIAEAEKLLSTAGFGNIRRLADTGLVNGVSGKTPGTCLATDQILFLAPAKSAGQRVVSGSRCIPPELPTVFLRGGDDRYIRWSTNGRKTIQAHPIPHRRLIKVIDGDSLSPFFIAVMSDESGASAEFRAVCKVDNRLVTSTVASIDGLDGKSAFLAGEAVGIQLDDARVLVWEMSSNQWHLVIALGSIIDFNLGLGDDGLRISMLLNGGDVEISNLGSENLGSQAIELDRLATRRDRIIDMGNEIYLIGESGWTAISATRPHSRHLNVKGGSVLDARRFRASSGFNQGLISIMRRTEGIQQKIVATIVTLDENGNESVLPEVDLTEQFANEKISSPTILAVPIDEVQSGINILLAYDQGNTGRIACLESTGVAENSRSSLSWVDTIDSGHDPSFYMKIHHEEEDKLVFVDVEIDYQTNIRGILGGCAR